MKKLLVWDADNTLWSGTLVENTAEGMSPQRIAQCTLLYERGVLQSVASRNILNDVLLKLEESQVGDYFLTPRADFEHEKSEMIRAIVETLGLSRMSDVVFIDDEPANRAEVQAQLPEVTVLSPEEFTSEKLDELFSKTVYTEEDHSRVRRYREELFRQQSAQAYSGDRQKFLAECELVVELSPAAQEDEERVVDLVRRANRMSVLAHDFTEEEVRRLLPWTVVGRVRDKFGDYGLSCLLTHINGEIQMFVISCRLQGKGIGSTMLGSLLQSLQEQGALEVTSLYRQTPYNYGMRSLYEWYEFSFEPTDLDSTVLCTCSLLNKEISLPPWITLVQSPGTFSPRATLGTNPLTTNFRKSS